MPEAVGNEKPLVDPGFPATPNHPLIDFMTRLTIPLAAISVFLLGCPPPSSTVILDPDHVFHLDDGDSLDAKLVRGEILVTRIVTSEGDSLDLENASIDRIINLRTGRDVTDRYIDREALKIELAKRAALAKRDRLKAEIAAGKKKKSELNRTPFAVLSAEFERSEQGFPQIAIALLNLSDKKISLVKTRIYCFDAKGQPQSGSKGKNHIFDATSRIPIGPGEDFTTTLQLRNHPKTRKAKIDIHYLEFSDRTWWKGKVEENVE